MNEIKTTDYGCLLELYQEQARAIDRNGHLIDALLNRLERLEHRTPPISPRHCLEACHSQRSTPKMRKHKSIPSERIVQAFLLVFCMVVTYYIVGCVAHLYFKRNYNHRTTHIHTAQTIDSPHIPTPTPSNLFAVIVSTNLVRIPCTCGYCLPSEGIAVPEHINQIGYDLKVEISTSYYPVVSLPTH